MLTVERGLDGSVAAAEADDSAINWAFHNEHLRYDVGKCITTTDGRFKQSGGFFGQSCRTSTGVADGIVAGSVAIGSFYSEGGYLDWGLSGIKPSTDTGLTAGTAYAFDLVLDEYNYNGKDTTTTEATISFTVDSSDTTFASGSNSVLPKIQAAINDTFRFVDGNFGTTTNLQKNRGATISLVNGDVRIRSKSNHSETIVGISAPTSGTTPFGVGRFPAVSSNVPQVLGNLISAGTDGIMYGRLATKAPETIIDKVTGKETINYNAFLLDDGNGNLLHNGNRAGSIDYTTGHCEFTHLPSAEFKVYGQSLAAHAGGVSFLATGYNSIQAIYARSINPKDNAQIQLVVMN